MKILFSIKYKIVLLFILLTASISYVFFSQTVDIFEVDKKAYLYSAAMSLVEGDEKVLDGEIKSLEQHTQVLSEYSLAGRLPESGALKNGHITCEQQNKPGPDQSLLDLKDQRVRLRVSRGEMNCEVQSKFFININQNLKNGFELTYYHPQAENKFVFEAPFVESVVKKNYTTGVVELLVGGEAYIVAYLKSFSGIYLIRFISKDKAFEALMFYKNKILLMGVMFLSLAGILSLGFAIKLTNPIMSLRDKMVLFGNKGSESDVFYHVVTRDEIGVIGFEFNSMVKKIKMLLDDLKVYNSQLETIIKKRTKDLRRATALQGAMINSLNQGFFMIDEKFKIQEVFSRSMVDLLGLDFEKGKVCSYLSSESFDEKSAKFFLENIFKETIPFSSLRALAPGRIFKNGKALDLSIEVVRRKDESILFVLFILNDVTEKLELEKRIEAEKNSGEIVLKIMSNQQNFLRMLNQLSSLFEVIERKNDVEKYELYRFAHTVKGAVLMYGLVDLAEEIHKYEDDIKTSNPDRLIEIKKMLCKSIDANFSIFFTKYPFLIGEQDWRRVAPFKMINIQSIRAFSGKLVGVDSELLADYNDQFIYTSIEETFNPLVEDIYAAALKLKKNVQVIVGDASAKIDPDLIAPHIPYLMHLTRNSIDHGIELEEERVRLGKVAHGLITISTSVGKREIRISISDDGKGIDTSLLIEKAQLNGMDISKKVNPVELIFEADLSTKEEVTEFSGRGVGLSAVREYFESVGGHVSVTTLVSSGTEFVITISV